MVGSLHQDKVERLQSAFSSTGKTLFLATKWNKKKWNQTNKLLKTEKNVRVCSTLYLAEQWQWPGRCPAVRLSQSQSAGRCSRPPAWPTAAGLVSVRPGITHTHTHTYLILSALMKWTIGWAIKVHDLYGSGGSHLHLHHFVLALGAEGPLVGQGVVVVGALVAVQSDGVTWQLDDLD